MAICYACKTHYLHLLWFGLAGYCFISYNYRFGILDNLSLALIFPAAYFMFITSITPGPNNIMLAASGMNFGYKRSLPHVVGIFSGLGLMIGLCAIGVGSLYEEYPILRYVLRAFSAIYLAYLAYKIAISGAAEMSKAAKPFTWFEAASFQFINPKAWVMAIGFASSFMPDFADLVKQLTFLLVISICMNFLCISCWVLFGQVMARLFTSEKTRKTINYVMAGLLLLMIPILVFL